MPKPQNKKELLEQSAHFYEKLKTEIEKLSDWNGEKKLDQNLLYRNPRDVVAHLYHWQFMLLDWYKVGQKGEKPDMPAKGYSWRETPRLNRDLQQQYSKHTEKELTSLLAESHETITALINKHSDDELFAKKLYSWTGSTSMGAYFTSAACSHYQWALKYLKKHF